ncbi:MAG TPA: hypothetical protein VM753_24125 [Anaeromyxobacter sp.]|nr:hypothetical protein [Anaeromyxobacter sp.]
MPSTRDRGDVIHFAGRHRLSPALRDDAPALVAQGEPGERCGWEPFFRAMDRHRVALAYDDDEPATRRFVPRDEAQPERRPLRPMEEVRRFLRALRRDR